MAWMIYGAYGYTGRLIAQLAKQRGEQPVLAGRNARKLASLAAELGMDHLVVDLADETALRRALTDVRLVAHCAGPFAHTAAPMVAACLETGTHYLDITGEIDVFEAGYARHAEAERAGVVLLPGAGFDVVPTDCLAAMLARALPEAAELELAFQWEGGISPGTLKTSLEWADAGGRARIDGQLRSVDVAHRQAVAEFPSGPRRVSAIPWGDLSSAHRSTGIGTITTYTVLPGADLIGKGQQLLAPLLRTPAVKRAGAALIEQFVTGPSPQRQVHGRAEVWGQVRADDGRRASGTLATPGPYALTADAVLRAVTRLLDEARPVSAGAHTPSTAFGADFVRELDGVTVNDIRIR